MARPNNTNVLPLLLLLLAFAATAVVAMKGMETVAGELGWVRSRGACRGTVEECMEWEADAVVRRVLQGGGSSGYIGYDALRRDSVPCSQRGASYYNCQPGAEANPYSRGCSAITQCRG